MMTLIYSGCVNIYLQGKEALEPVIKDTGCMEYYVAYPESKILVRDYRENVAAIAKKALAGEDVNFAKTFSQPAWVEIRSKADSAEILIKNSSHLSNAKTLWLGVIRDSRMSVQDVDWELLKPVGEDAIAFAALVA